MKISIKCEGQTRKKNLHSHNCRINFLLLQLKNHQAAKKKKGDRKEGFKKLDIATESKGVLISSIDADTPPRPRSLLLSATFAFFLKLG
jgi:hypothetical protein